VKVELSKIDM